MDITGYDPTLISQAEETPTPPDRPTFGPTGTVNLGEDRVEFTIINTEDGGTAILTIPGQMEGPTGTITSAGELVPSISLRINFENGGIEDKDLSIGDQEILSIIQTIYSTKFALENILPQGDEIRFPENITIDIYLNDEGEGSGGNIDPTTFGRLQVSVRMGEEDISTMTTDEINIRLSDNIRTQLVIGLVKSYFNTHFNQNNQFNIESLVVVFPNIREFESLHNVQQVEGNIIMNFIDITFRDLIKKFDTSPELTYAQYLEITGNTQLQLNARTFEYFRSGIFNDFEGNFSSIFSVDEWDYPNDTTERQSVTIDQRANVPSSTLNLEGQESGGLPVVELVFFLVSAIVGITTAHIYRSHKKSPNFAPNTKVKPASNPQLVENFKRKYATNEGEGTKTPFDATDTNGSDLTFTILPIPEWVEKIQFENLNTNRSKKARAEITDITNTISSGVTKGNSLTKILENLDGVSYKQIGDRGDSFEITYIRFNQNIKIIFDSNGNIISEEQ